MFDYETPKEKEPVDYTGLRIAAVTAPVFFLVTYLYNADAGLAACIVLDLHCVRCDNLRHQTPLAFNEARLVLGHHCCYLGAQRLVSFHGSMAQQCAYDFLRDADRDRGFSDHLGSFRPCRKTLLHLRWRGMKVSWRYIAIALINPLETACTARRPTPSRLPLSNPAGHLSFGVQRLPPAIDHQSHAPSRQVRHAPMDTVGPSSLSISCTL